jgi:hypothetical protein
VLSSINNLEEKINDLADKIEEANTPPPAPRAQKKK